MNSRMFAAIALFVLAFTAIQAKAETDSSFVIYGLSDSVRTTGIISAGVDLLLDSELSENVVHTLGQPGSAAFCADEPSFSLGNGSARSITNSGLFASISEATCNDRPEAFVGSTSTIRQGAFTDFDPVSDLLFNGLAGKSPPRRWGDLAFLAYTTNSNSVESLHSLALDLTTLGSIAPASGIRV